MADEKRPYSYHTFLCPLLLGKKGKKNLEKALQNTALWEKKSSYHGDSEADAYQVRRYFTPAAWNAMFEDDKGADTSNYIRLGMENARYVIEKGEKTYTLDVNMIRLKVYGQIAVLIFELEYYQDGKPQIDDILKINCFGRRLYAPFFAPGNSCSECADKLSITGIVSQTLCGEGVKIPEGEMPLPDLIKSVLGVEDTDDIRMETDERMFVCCCIADQEYVNGFLDGRCKDGISKEWEKRKELYAVTNIDSDTDGTCHNEVMMDRFFDEQLYLRWSDFMIGDDKCGTIHALTNHSWVLLTGEGAYYAAVKPFLIEYVEMCVLGIAQRASLASFDERITNALSDKNDKKKEIELVKLEDEFANFQGQLLLGEVTKQIQGIELYNKLQTQLRINEIAEGVRQRLSILYELAETKQEGRLNSVLTVLTFMTVASVLADAAGYLAGWGNAWWAALAALVVVIVAALFFIKWYAKKEKTTVPAVLRGIVRFFRDILKKGSSDE